MHKLRPAFTIIEILVSITIISFSILFVLRVHSDNRKYIIYLSERNKHALQDSLFLTENILRYHKSKKTAYDIIERNMKVKEDESRQVLKKYERSIYIPEEIRITPPPPPRRGPTALVNEVKLKGQHSSYYWHVDIKKF